MAEIAAKSCGSACPLHNSKSDCFIFEIGESVPSQSSSMYADDELADFDSETSPEREQEGGQPSGEALPVGGDDGPSPAPMQVDQEEEAPVQEVVVQVHPVGLDNANEDGPDVAEEDGPEYDSSDPEWQRHYLRPGGSGREMLGKPAYRPSQPDIYRSQRYQRGVRFFRRPTKRKEQSHSGHGRGSACRKRRE